MIRFVFLFIFMQLGVGGGESLAADFYPESLCQKFLRGCPEAEKSVEAMAAKTNCQAEYDADGCGTYIDQLIAGLSPVEAGQARVRVRNCTLQDICASPVNAMVFSCAKGATYNAIKGLLTAPFAAIDFMQEAFARDKACFADLAGKAQLLDAFNRTVVDPKFQFDPLFFEGEYLAHIPCHELNAQIERKKQQYLAAIGPKVARGEMQSPFQREPDIGELVKQGAQQLQVRLSCLRPEVQAEFACEFAAFGLLGKFAKAKIASLELKGVVPDLAGAKNRYHAVGMQKRYLGENQGKMVDGKLLKVKYLPTEALKRFEVEVREGKLYYKASQKLVTTGSMPTIYVMDADGKIYMGLPRQKDGVVFHHSSYLAGGEVAGAGEIRVQDGVIMRINRNSGHYAPTPVLFEQVLQELSKRGLYINPRRISYGVGDLI